MQGDAIAARLAKLVEIAGSQRKFADIVGKTSPAVHGWLHGSIPYPATLELIARKTGVSLDWLLRGQGHEETELGEFRRMLARGGPLKRHVGNIMAEDPPHTHTTGGLIVKKLPIISMAQAGKSAAWEDVDDYEGVETFAVKDARAIAVRIRGDSMAPDYKAGTVAILYPSVKPQSDHLVIVRLKNGDVMFKRLQIVGDEFHFLSVNPKYETVIAKAEEIDRMLSVGKTERAEL